MPPGVAGADKGGHGGPPLREAHARRVAVLIEARGVVKSYAKGAETVRVLHGVDVDVDDGEWVALMGPSGSGKTTLLNLLGGLDVPDEGSIVVGGEELAGRTNRELAAWRARHVG